MKENGGYLRVQQQPLSSTYNTHDSNGSNCSLLRSAVLYCAALLALWVFLKSTDTHPKIEMYLERFTPVQSSPKRAIKASTIESGKVHWRSRYAMPRESHHIGNILVCESR